MSQADIAYWWGVLKERYQALPVDQLIALVAQYASTTPADVIDWLQEQGDDA